VIELPAGLHGAFLREELQARLGALGVRAMVREGRLVPVTRRVLVDRARQLELLTRAAAALLHVGGESALTTHTAARLFGCTAADAGRVHVLVGYDRTAHRTPGVALHQGLFDEQDIVDLVGLRVHALDCAIAELLCRANRRTALACADQAIALSTDEGFRAEVLHRIATRRDSRGRRRGEILLELASGLSESPAESWLLLGFFDGGLPIPRQQEPILDADGRERYRLDFAWEEVRVAVEYDGYAAHVGRALRDSLRQTDLERRGWTVIRADAADLKDPACLHAEIRQSFGRRRYAA
jgi:hypothetical protein